MYSHHRWEVFFDYVGDHVDGGSMEQASIDERKERKEERCFPVGNSES